MRQVVVAGADRIHVDAMNNHDVLNLSFGPMAFKAVFDAMLARLPG